MCVKVYSSSVKTMKAHEPRAKQALPPAAETEPAAAGLMLLCDIKTPLFKDEEEREEIQRSTGHIAHDPVPPWLASALAAASCPYLTPPSPELQLGCRLLLFTEEEGGGGGGWLDSWLLASDHRLCAYKPQSRSRLCQTAPDSAPAA